jgi:holo-[acyl-carrier protein] synthase
MYKISGLGIDIVSISRIDSIYEKYKNKFLDKIFTKNEINEAIEKGHFIQSISGKFAAKEAFIKANSFKTNTINLKEIEILTDKKDNKPYVYFKNTNETKKYFLSISHEIEYAVAIVIAESK